jgi:dCTP deaminase
MILAESALRKALESGEIILTPPIPAAHVGPGSIDLRLGSSFLVIDTVIAENRKAGVESIIDLASYRFGEFAARFGRTEVAGPEEGFLLRPNRLVLASTLEHITLVNSLAARVEGKSSLARVGLFVHITAPTVQPGWRGHLQLELLNVGPATLRLHPERPVCQLVVERVEGEGSYSGQFLVDR